MVETKCFITSDGC